MEPPMRKFLVFLLVAFLALGSAAPDAFAKRFGGGKSFGQQRQSTSQPVAPPASPMAPGSAPAAGGNRWLGPLAGLAAGGLLAAMFMGHGFEGINFMDIVAVMGIGAVIFFIFRAMRRAPQTQAVQYAGYGGQTVENIPSGGSATPVSGKGRPAWFDEETFLRAAKANFIRLQAAYDAKNLDDIREYTTPEVFAEISLQLQERGDKPQKTDVVSVNAELVNVVTEGDLTFASVRYSGMIREEENGAAAPFNEIWHVQRAQLQPNASWFIAGIQQNA
jgi:predicted lipid-binding transport protein (Tim44 family)